MRKVNYRQGEHSVVFIQVMEKRRKRMIRKRLVQSIVMMALIAATVMMAAFLSHAEEETEIIIPQAKNMTYSLPSGGVGVLIAEGKVQMPEKQTPAYEFDSRDKYLLAKIAMAEAEGEDTEGKALVILTVLNRVKASQFPDSIGEVILQQRNGKYQFTPIKNERFFEVEPNEDCYEALNMVIEGWDESKGALYFERTTNKSTWHNRQLDELFIHGNHTFYTEVVEP